MMAEMDIPPPGEVGDNTMDIPPPGEVGDNTMDIPPPGEVGDNNMDSSTTNLVSSGRAKWFKMKYLVVGVMVGLVAMVGLVTTGAVYYTNDSANSADKSIPHSKDTKEKGQYKTKMYLYFVCI